MLSQFAVNCCGDRCGRAGMKGIAHTFVIDEDRHLTPALVEVLETNRQSIPMDLAEMAHKVRASASHSVIANRCESRSLVQLCCFFFFSWKVVSILHCGRPQLLKLPYVWHWIWWLQMTHQLTWPTRAHHSRRYCSTLWFEPRANKFKACCTTNWVVTDMLWTVWWVDVRTDTVGCWKFCGFMRACITLSGSQTIVVNVC